MNIRDDFPMLDRNLTYFDNGATTLKPYVVINALTDYYENYSANAHRGDYDISIKVDTAYELSRQKISQFINAKRSDEIIFTSGSTESLNMLVFGFFKSYLKKDDEILLTKSEHASNLLPWFILCEQIGCYIKYIPLDDDLKVTLDNVSDMITNRTKVISLAHITNVVGDVRPIKAITSLAHQHNVLVVVDGAQSVPHMKTDVQASDIDFLVFSGHKMCGPTGIGVLYGKYKLLDQVAPINYGGGMNSSFTTNGNIELKSLPARLEAGTPNIAGAIGLGSAIDYLNQIGIERIHQYEVDLRRYLVNKLLEIDYIDIYNLKSESGIIAFNVDGIFSQDLAVYLNKFNICVRAGNHCAKILKDELGINNTCRISLYFYNTKDEVDNLIEILKDKQRIINNII